MGCSSRVVATLPNPMPYQATSRVLHTDLKLFKHLGRLFSIEHESMCSLTHLRMILYILQSIQASVHDRVHRNSNVGGGHLAFPWTVRLR